MAAPSTRLSPHFRLREFAMDDGTPAPIEAENGLARLCRDVLEPMRARFGVCTVTSGYRTRLHNHQVGGARDSRHLYDVHPSTPAVDVKFAKGTPEQWAALAISMKVGGVGLYKGHVHLDQRRGSVRW